MAELLDRISEDLADIVQAAGPGIVRVEARQRLPASGMVWSQDGVIVTTHHVIERQERIRVGLPDGPAIDASLIGRDPTTDDAVLKVQASDLSPLRRADADTARVGQLVLALGRPGSAPAATLGVVSALGGPWRTHAGGSLDHYLQTDAVMYPGFSGGPLVDASGRALGINTSALLRGIAITISSSSLERIVGALLSHGRIKRGYLGIGTQPARLPERLHEEVGQETGLLVVSVEPDSPADAAGLMLGDALVGLDGRPVRQVDDLLSRLDGDLIGRSAAARIVRGGQVQELSVVVGERP